MADPGIDGVKGGRQRGVWGRACPQVRRSGSSAPAGVQGAEPSHVGLGAKPPQKRPQKLKPKTALGASRKAFSDVECQECPTATFKSISRYT